MKDNTDTYKNQEREINPEIKYPEHHHTVKLKNDLRISALVLSQESESGLVSINYTLAADDEPYGITLIQNPLIDYERAMNEVDKMIADRLVYFEQYGRKMEPPECSRKHILNIWTVAHWYRVDQLADGMTAGMSVAAWLGMNRTHNWFKP